MNETAGISSDTPQDSVDGVIGFDTAEPLTTELIQSARTRLGGRLQAVGRYVDGLYAATRADVAIAHAQRLAVWLISSTSTAADVRGTLPAGRSAGMAAGRAAGALQAPHGTMVALDIESGWSPSADWVAGWAYGILQTGYRPAVYGSPSDAGFTAAVVEARRRYAAVDRQLLVWAAHWLESSEPATLLADEPLRWNGWQYAGNVSLSIGSVDFDLWRPGTPGLWEPDKRPTPKVALPLTVRGNSSATLDRFTFPITLAGTKPHSLWILHDTGAFELLLDGATASACGAPNLGPTEVAGVTGSSVAYWSEVDVTIAGRTWRRVPCVVDPTASEPLWGYRFYQDRGYGLQINTVQQALTIWDARTSAKP